MFYVKEKLSQSNILRKSLIVFTINKTKENVLKVTKHGSFDKKIASS